eukprot:5658551-Pleurochrysis_carterae.AAC.1
MVHLRPLDECRGSSACALTCRRPNFTCRRSSRWRPAGPSTWPGNLCARYSQCRGRARMRSSRKALPHRPEARELG